MSNPQIHKGHRQRLKTRFLEEGLDNFSDIQVLELVLFFSIPRRIDPPPSGGGQYVHQRRIWRLRPG